MGARCNWGEAVSRSPWGQSVRSPLPWGSPLCPIRRGGAWSPWGSRRRLAPAFHRAGGARRGSGDRSGTCGGAVVAGGVRCGRAGVVGAAGFFVPGLRDRGDRAVRRSLRRRTLYAALDWAQAIFFTGRSCAGVFGRRSSTFQQMGKGSCGQSSSIARSGTRRPYRPRVPKRLVEMLAVPVQDA